MGAAVTVEAMEVVAAGVMGAAATVEAMEAVAVGVMGVAMVVEMVVAVRTAVANTHCLQLPPPRPGSLSRPCFPMSPPHRK